MGEAKDLNWFHDDVFSKKNFFGVVKVLQK